LSQLLTSQQQGALELCCQLRVSEATAVHEFSVGLFQPSAQPDHLWQLLRLQLESVQVSGPIASVTLIASATSSLVAQQIHLWDDMPLLPDSAHDPFGLSSSCRQREHGEFLAQLIERLSSRLGSDTVSGVGLRAARLPEAAYARLPLTGSSGAAAARRRNHDRAPVLAPNLRPLWLIQPPVSLQVTRLTPAGLPQEFSDGTTWQAAADYLGPERIETAWWQGPIVRRDYYRVRCVSGMRLWLFQNLIDQRWFLQGMFD
jgi:protein ImuB